MLFNKKLYGNVTILLTLTLTTIICVIFNILESARITSIKTYYTDVSQLAADSLLEIIVTNYLRTMVYLQLIRQTLIALNTYSLLQKRIFPRVFQPIYFPTITIFYKDKLTM